MHMTTWVYVLGGLLAFSIICNIFLADFVIYLHNVLNKLEVDLLVKDDVFDEEPRGF